MIKRLGPTIIDYTTVIVGKVMYIGISGIFAQYYQ